MKYDAFLKVMDADNQAGWKKPSEPTNLWSAKWSHHYFCEYKCE